MIGGIRRRPGRGFMGSPLLRNNFMGVFSWRLGLIYSIIAVCAGRCICGIPQIMSDTTENRLRIFAPVQWRLGEMQPKG